MRNIIVEVYSLNPEELTYRPVHGDGQFYDDFTGYDVKDITKNANELPNHWDIVFLITDRRNSSHIFLYGVTDRNGKRSWLFKEEDKETKRLPFDHISVYEVLNDNTRIYL